MSAAFALLILLIAGVPVLAFVGGVISTGCLLAIVAMAIALIVLTLPAGEFRQLGALWKPIAPLALIPCIWMLAQLVPVPGWLAHPAWTSASAALGHSLAGSVTLDTGATLLGLCRYSLVLAIAIVATAVALDRRRAETILFVLTAAAALSIAAYISLELGFSHFTNLGLSAQRPQMLTVAVLGLILSCATVLRVYENYRRRRAIDASMMIAATASCVAMAICLAAFAIDGGAALPLAALSGVVILIGMAVIQRLRFGPWGQAGVVAAAAIGLIGLLLSIPANRAVDPTLALSGQPQVSIATAERMLSDAKWAGSGAGAFAALLPIYRDVEDATVDAAATAAASIAIEMGRPLLWLLVILSLIGAMDLLRRAVRRDRDYVYAATGAACIVAVLVSSFVNAGILGLAASLLASAICGLALAQSRNWSV